MAETTFLDGRAEDVAPRLLGCYLQRDFNGHTVTVKIVETEAYTDTDAASHSYHGRSSRNEVMFGPGGHLYVYFTYGLHYCMNVVTGPVGEGSAVLIRAARPVAGIPLLRSNRGGKTIIECTNGPAKLCQALMINKAHNGHDLTELPLKLLVKPALPPEDIVQSTRVGISKSQELPWRFYCRNDPFVSRPLSE